MYTEFYTYTHTCTHTYIHVYIHKYLYTLIRTYTQINSFLNLMISNILNVETTELFTKPSSPMKGIWYIIIYLLTRSHEVNQWDESTQGKFLMFFWYPFMSQGADNVAGHTQWKKSFRWISYLFEHWVTALIAMRHGENKPWMKCIFIFVLDIKKYWFVIEHCCANRDRLNWKTFS